MPDWLSHILLALIICEIFKIKKKSLVVLGALLPDFLLKLYILNIFTNMPNNLYWLLVPFHTPFSLIIMTFLIIPFFKYSWKKAYILIAIGWISHILLDLTIADFTKKYMLILFPFSWEGYEINLIWQQQYYFILIPLFLVYIILLLRNRKKHKIKPKTV